MHHCASVRGGWPVSLAASENLIATSSVVSIQSSAQSHQEVARRYPSVYPPESLSPSCLFRMTFSGANITCCFVKYGLKFIKFAGLNMWKWKATAQTLQCITLGMSHRHMVDFFIHSLLKKLFSELCVTAPPPRRLKTDDLHLE